MSDPIGESPDVLRWQYILLPVMVALVLSLAAYFVIESKAQVNALQHHLQEESHFAMDSVLARADPTHAVRTPAQREFELLASLEAYALDKRHHQSNLMLMSRTWTRYMAFLTGMILSFIGAIFVLGKLSTPATKVDVGVESGRAALESTSPGLFLVLFGTILMLTAEMVHVDVSIKDTAVFLPVTADAAPGGLASPAPATQPRPTSIDSILKDLKKPLR